MLDRKCQSSWCTNVLLEKRKSKRCLDCDRHFRARWLEKQDSTLVKARNRKASNAHYERNKERYRAKKREERTLLRNQMLDAYGSKCSCCGENERAFLTLEHLNRDGKAHRVAVSGDNKTGGWSDNVYADLKCRGWPQDAYTLLCYNCNNASWHYGICPHKREIHETLPSV